MEKMLLKQGKPCNRNIKKMEPIQGNPCSLSRYAPCNVCFCFDFHDFFFLSTGFSEQGFPCIDYNYFMFQLQNLKGCCHTL
jgi:hypothetical protein